MEILTRARKRINDYYTSENQNQNNNDEIIENDEIVQNDEHLEPATKRAKITIPRILDGKYFSIISNINGNIVARCTECNEQKKGSVTSTGNFKSHFRIKHSEILPTVEAYLKSKGVETTVAQPTMHRFIFKPEKVN